MTAHVILGINIDTPFWIASLIKKGAKNIIVLDYESQNEIIIKGEITYINVLEIKEYLSKFDCVKYYKTLYIYPGISGKDKI